LFSSVNGRSNATIDLADRGLAFGDGVFETLLLAQGKLPFLSLHLDRLQLGLDGLHIEACRQNIQDQVNQCLAQTSKQQFLNGIVKIIVTRGQGRGYLPQAQTEATILISAYPLPELQKNYQRDGVAICICQHRLSYQPALLGIKHLNRLDNVLAALELRDKNTVEGLILDDQGFVAEAVSRNLFTVKDGQLFTPDLLRGGIKGIMQGIVVEQLAPQLDLSVNTGRLTPQQVVNADEVFLCNSITGIWPVIRIDEQELSPGPVTQSLQVAAQKLSASLLENQ
jgi:4-amino-4-deoxychorismate lyase